MIKDKYGRPQLAYVVQNISTGKKYQAIGDYARKLEKKGYRIVSKEGDKDFSEQIVKSEGK